MCPSRRAQSNCTVRRLHRLVVSSAALGRLFAIAVAISASHATAYADDDPVKPFQAAIADVREHFWKSGALGASLNASLAPIEAGLQALANRSTGGLRARALLELGRTQRMDNAYAASILTLTECAKLADAAALPDVAFDAWLNIARAYVIGIHDYGAASDAIDHADTLAGDHPSQKQQLDLADMRAILFESRGEPEASLVEAVAAARLAQTPEDRYFSTGTPRMRSTRSSTVVSRWVSSTAKARMTATSGGVRASASWPRREPCWNEPVRLRSSQAGHIWHSKHAKR